MGRNSALLTFCVMPVAIAAFPALLVGQDDPPSAVVERADLEEPGGTDLLSLDIEQLRRIPIAPALEEVVSTVAWQESTVGRSPAAVYVVTPEMIRRSGAQTIPEALRMVPGLQVAQRDSNKWAVSSRGFNTTFANKLLVQIDGRTVYTPVFAGTYWDVQDVVLEDIERIEVIRGPGATVWGANAVNGVINIITKSAKDTRGVYAKAGGGTREEGFSTLRMGGGQDDLSYRAYFKWFERDGGVGVGGPAFLTNGGRSGVASAPTGRRTAATRSLCKATSMTAAAAQRFLVSFRRVRMFKVTIYCRVGRVLSTTIRTTLFKPTTMRPTARTPSRSRSTSRCTTPQNQVFLMSSWDLAEDVEFDVMGRYVDSLPGQSAPRYFSLDLRLGWQPAADLELSVVGRNLLDGQHVEFGNVDGRPTPVVAIPRGVFGYVTWRR